MAAQRRRGDARTSPQTEPLTAEQAQAKIDAGQGFLGGLRDQAKDIKGAEYDGKLTSALWVKLEPLLSTPTPPDYIEHREGGDGNPYPTTGLASAQIQYDILNAVLGKAHYRVMLHYAQQGTLCKTVIVVGNDLHFCRLSNEGDLLLWTPIGPSAEDGTAEVGKAEVFALHEGWGGWKSRTPGDTFKASETNASKRVIARLGPGGDVYRVEYDADILAALQGREPEEHSFQPPAARQRGQSQAQTPREDTQRVEAAREPSGEEAQAAPSEERRPPEVPSDEAAEQMLTDMTTDGAADEPLLTLRREANEAMASLPEHVRPGAAQRWQLLNPRKDDEQQLRDLLQRARNAAESAAG